MKFLLIGVLALAIASVAIANGRQKYDGYRLLNVFPENEEQIKLLIKLEENPDFDIWNNAKGIKPQVDVLLSPSAFLTYSALFNLYNMKYVIADNNIQNKIDEQEQSDVMARRQARKNIVGIFASYTEIQDYLDEIADALPQVFKTEIIGQSIENRNLKIIKASTGNPKRKVWIDCGIHARERISPATCIYLIDYLKKGYESNDANVLTLLAHYQWEILPLVNPDGYEFARTTTPMWRKNRRVNSGTTCIGVDLNRNYGHFWMYAGASSNPCSDTYAGSKADSEPETQAVEKHIMKSNSDYDSFLTIHTYGLWWFTPWGYSSTVLPADYNEMMTHVTKAKDAIKASHSKGSTFVIGSSAQILYEAAGGSDDWAKGVANIKHSCTLELRPGQTGVDSSYGFLLPADRINDAGLETVAGIMAYFNSIKV